MENIDPKSKLALRTHFRQLRMRINMEDGQLWSRQIADQVLDLPEFESASVVFSYLSNWGEVDTNRILETCLADGKTVLIPTADHKLLPEHGFYEVVRMYEGRAITQLYEGGLSIREIDTILVPGIVWDPAGHRIGFGGGYFDRLLAEKRSDSRAIGLSYDLQIIDSVPNDEWDQRVDLVVTQSRIYRPDPI